MSRYLTLALLEGHIQFYRQGCHSAFRHSLSENNKRSQHNFDTAGIHVTWILENGYANQ